MPRYKVSLTETVNYKIEIDAESGEAAETLAVAMWNESENHAADGWEEFGGGVTVDWHDKVADEPGDGEHD